MKKPNLKWGGRSVRFHFFVFSILFCWWFGEFLWRVMGKNEKNGGFCRFCFFSRAPLFFTATVTPTPLVRFHINERALVNWTLFFVETQAPLCHWIVSRGRKTCLWGWKRSGGLYVRWVSRRRRKWGCVSSWQVRGDFFMNGSIFQFEKSNAFF